MQYGTVEVAQLLKFTSEQIQDGGPTFLSLNFCNSAEDCQISLKCSTEYDNMTADTLRTCKVKESKVEVTV